MPTPPAPAAPAAPILLAEPVSSRTGVDFREPSFTTSGSVSPSTVICSLWPRGTARTAPSRSTHCARAALAGGWPSAALWALCAAVPARPPAAPFSADEATSRAEKPSSRQPRSRVVGDGVQASDLVRGSPAPQSFVMTAPATGGRRRGGVYSWRRRPCRPVFAGREKTGTVIRVPLVLSLRSVCSARRVFCMIFVWELRMPAKADGFHLCLPVGAILPGQVRG